MPRSGPAKQPDGIEEERFSCVRQDEPTVGGGRRGVGYDVQAVIAGDEVLRIASRELPGSAVVRLGQGLSMMPMTDGLFGGVGKH